MGQFLQAIYLFPIAIVASSLAAGMPQSFAAGSAASQLAAQAPVAEPVASDLDLRTLYDVQSYALDLEVFPEQERIEGRVMVAARVLSEMVQFQLDLVDELEVREVLLHGDLNAEPVSLEFEHRRERLTIALGSVLAPDSDLRVEVAYSGYPKARDRFTGFHWSKTSAGIAWINTSCQGNGAHSWWPCKASFFHPEDKPERVSVSVTVPSELVAVSNGRLLDVIDREQDRRTYRWQHSYPLETYSLTLNIGPYVETSKELVLDGIEGPVTFATYMLPESVEQAALQFASVPRLLEVYGQAFGPFPFPDSKVGFVQTNFWGMEHSTAIAYGSSFPAWIEQHGGKDAYASRNAWFDYILVHEFAHEWWGNAVSAKSWGDFWIHEGFATYAEGIWVEAEEGRERADEFFLEQARRIPRNAKLWRGENVNSEEAYTGSIYSKGATVLHSLRHYVNDDDAWWESLRRFQLEHRYGNASTDDFRRVLEEVTGLSWKRFFKQWVYGEGYPSLKGRIELLPGEIALEIENKPSAGTGFHVPLDLTWEEDLERKHKRVLIPPAGLTENLPCARSAKNLKVQGLKRVLGRHQVTVVSPD